MHRTKRLLIGVAIVCGVFTPVVSMLPASAQTGGSTTRLGQNQNSNSSNASGQSPSPAKSLVTGSGQANSSAGQQCPKPAFFFLPPWYEYLTLQHDSYTNTCYPDFNFPKDIPAVVLAIVDMLLRLAGFVAIVSIIIAGFGYAFSGGNPEKAASARWRMYNSLIGLAIVAVATATVTFIGKQFT